MADYEKAGEWAKDIMAWASEAQTWTAAQAGAKAREVFIKICEYSPRQGYGRFSVGHFMKNWQAGSSPSFGELLGNTTLTQKISEIDNIIDDEFFLSHNTAYFCNNTSYASNIEYTGWTYTDAYRPVEKGIAGARSPVAQAIASSLE